MSAVLCEVCRNCGSETVELRQKRATNGARMIAYQCLTCGQAASSWLKNSTVANPDRLGEWDPSIAEARAQEQRAEWESKYQSAIKDRAQANEEWWARYNAYLRTPAWRSRRSLVLQRAGGWCEGCRKTEATQVHHLTYDHVCNEFLWELVAICDDCHERVHEGT